MASKAVTWAGSRGPTAAPEFAREVFGGAEVGVLARLVHSRFGLHVVEVVARDPGQQPSFEEVRQAIALTLRQQAWVNALAPVPAVAGRCGHGRRGGAGRRRHAPGAVSPGTLADDTMPDELLDRLRRFHNDAFPQYREQFQNLVDEGQHPTTLFIGCSDSRLVPYMLTGCGAGGAVSGT